MRALASMNTDVDRQRRTLDESLAAFAKVADERAFLAVDASVSTKSERTKGKRRDKGERGRRHFSRVSLTFNSAQAQSHSFFKTRMLSFHDHFYQTQPRIGQHQDLISARLGIPDDKGQIAT